MAPAAVRLQPLPQVAPLAALKKFPHAYAFLPVAVRSADAGPLIRRSVHLSARLDAACLLPLPARVSRPALAPPRRSRCHRSRRHPDIPCAVALIAAAARPTGLAGVERTVDLLRTLPKQQPPAIRQPSLAASSRRYRSCVWGREDLRTRCKRPREYDHQDGSVHTEPLWHAPCTFKLTTSWPLAHVARSMGPRLLPSQLLNRRSISA